MSDIVSKIFVHGLSIMFVVGVAGCLFVIPITAYRLFSVLFQRDHEGEQ
jgi:hypothetical protein